MDDIRNISADSLSTVLVEQIPELAQAMREEASFWGDYGVSSIGPDTAFSLVLAPFVIERLKREEENRDDSLRRVFEFLEELTHSEDDAVLSAIDVSFGEELLADHDAFDRAMEYMGPRLRETFTQKQAMLRSLPERGSFR